VFVAKMNLEIGSVGASCQLLNDDGLL